MNDKDETEREIPQSDEYGTPNAQAFDGDGNVRPADGRWLGDRNDDLSDEERIELREKELEDADAKLAERMERDNNPDAPPVVAPGPDDGPEPPPAEQEPQEPLVANPSLPEDPYAETQYADLQQAAKARGINAGGTADEIRARLNAADAEANSGITPTPTEQ